MKILGYGEDAVTLWAITCQLSTILDVLHDTSDPSCCEIIFRPNFGRARGPSSPQFGEFDFIILSEQAALLGEIRWDRPSDPVKVGRVELRPEEILRHRIFRFYVQEYAYKGYASWVDFVAEASARFSPSADGKPLAPERSLLRENLEMVLKRIRSRYASIPVMRDVLLYLHGGRSKAELPSEAPEGFALVHMDYSADVQDGMIQIGG